MAALDRQSLLPTSFAKRRCFALATSSNIPLEQKLTEALLARTTDNDNGRLRIRLLSVVVIGVLRVGGENGMRAAPGSIEAFARDIFSQLWRVLADFGNDIQADPKAR